MVNIETHQLRQVLDFIIEVDKLKTVTRKVKPLSNDRYENSAEHSWHIALLALSFDKYLEEPVDINRVIKMLLIHDIGEIYSGDTLFFTEGGWKERKEEELFSFKKVVNVLPESIAGEFVELWEEFENASTPEAKFANAIDRVMPVLLNLNNKGQSWRENNISYDTVVKKVSPPIKEGFPKLWEYISIELETAKKSGYFLN